MKWCQPTIHASWQKEKHLSLLSQGRVLLLRRVVTQTHCLSPAFFSWSRFFVPSMLLVLRNVFSSWFHVSLLSLSCDQSSLAEMLCPVQERHGHTGKSPTEIRQDDKWSRAPLLWGEAEKAGTAQPVEDEAQGISSMSTNTWRVGAKRMEWDSLQWCSVSGQETVGTYWNTRRSVWTPGSTAVLCCAVL